MNSLCGSFAAGFELRFETADARLVLVELDLALDAQFVILDRRRR